MLDRSAKLSRVERAKNGAPSFLTSISTLKLTCLLITEYTLTATLLTSATTVAVLWPDRCTSLCRGATRPAAMLSGNSAAFLDAKVSHHLHLHRQEDNQNTRKRLVSQCYVMLILLSHPPPWHHAHLEIAATWMENSGQNAAPQMHCNTDTMHITETYLL